MAYTKTTWVDDITPLSAANMNNIESGIETIDQTIVTVAAANKVLKLNAQGKLPASITGDAQTIQGHQPGLIQNGGTFIEATEIASSATYTKSIPLGSNNYTFAIVRFVRNTDTEFSGAIVTAKTTIGSGHCLISNARQQASPDFQGAGSRGVHSTLSKASAVPMNEGVSGNSSICLEHVYINGSNLEIKWKNISASPYSLNIYCHWEVFK